VQINVVHKRAQTMHERFVQTKFTIGEVEG